MDAETRLAAKLNELGMTMPSPPAPKGSYRSVVEVGNLIYTSGHLPIQSSGELVTGRLGAELDVPAGYAAARLVGLNILASLRKHLGSLQPGPPRGKASRRGQLHARVHQASRSDRRLQRIVCRSVWAGRGRRGSQCDGPSRLAAWRGGRDRGDLRDRVAPLRLVANVERMTQLERNKGKGANHRSLALRREVNHDTKVVGQAHPCLTNASQ